MNWAVFTASPLFGFTLTVLCMVVFHLLFGRSRSILLNPFLFSMVVIVLFLKLTGTPYAQYERGASILSFFLGPAIVALAVPLYKQIDKVRANALPVLLGIAVGVVVSIVSGIALSMLFGLSREIAVSMAPKGATSAISMNLASIQGGDPAMTMAFVNVAGISGYVLGIWAFKLLRINSPVARGISLGTAAHAMGIKRALELGEEEGAMGSLSIGLAGVFTSLFLPFLLRLFGY